MTRVYANYSLLSLSNNIIRIIKEFKLIDTIYDIKAKKETLVEKQNFLYN